MRWLRSTKSMPCRRRLSVALGVETLESREVLSAAGAAFVQKLYVDVLGRPADQAGLSHFSTQLEQGRTPAQVAQGLLGSTEYQTNTAQQLYNVYLQRGADAGGLSAVVNALSKGASADQVAVVFAGSAEYFQSRGAGSNAGYLQALYSDVLGRPIDGSGQQMFSQALAAGVTRQQVAAVLLSSQEYHQIEVNQLFARYLKRAADPSGLATFTAALDRGVSVNQVISVLASSGEYNAAFGNLAAASSSTAERATAAPGVVPLTPAEVQALLDRASAATKSTDAIIAIVDRGGRILGVRIEDGVIPEIRNRTDPVLATFAIDGAVALARTGAFFGNDQAPLTSRTVRSLSETTMPERAVNANPNILDPNSTDRGPGFVAAIGIAGHFPRGVPFSPQVDLFLIEGTNRDSSIHPGLDGIKGTADDIVLPSRFNVPTQFLDPEFLPGGSLARDVLVPPDSYGFVSGLLPTGQARGVGTLPGGLPIFKVGSDGAAHVVGGIGVFFPGKTGFASEENSVFNSNFNPSKPDRSLEAEFMGIAALGGVVKNPNVPSQDFGLPMVGTLDGVPRLNNIVLPAGRIDLVGITLEIYGPGGTDGGERLYKLGQTLGLGTKNGVNVPVTTTGATILPGGDVAEGWLVLPHGSDDGTITREDVIKIVQQGIDQSNRTRAAIRLQPGEPAKMVLSVSDKAGNLLGVFRMHDATIFSIDVATAKSRNVSYYADPTQLQPIDQIAGVPKGVAFTNRTFRFAALPHFPEGIDAAAPGPFSILNDGGTNLPNGLQVGPRLPASAFQSVMGFVAFNPARNFHDPNNIANQSGIVFFPGAVPLYKDLGTGTRVLVGGFGISGDGVDQDDVVTQAGAVGFTPPPSILRADQIVVRGVGLPYQKGNRNPEGGI